MVKQLIVDNLHVFKGTALYGESKKKLFGKWIFKEMFCLVIVYPA